MAVNRGLYVPINTTGNVGTNELEARLAQAGQYEHNAAGIPRSGLLIPNESSANIVTGAANMSYNLGSCYPVINTAANDGVYTFSATGTTNITVAADGTSLVAPATGSRIDLLWVKQNDKSKGDPDNLAVFGVTKGVAATTPVAPALPARALEVARATILSTTTATNTAVITQTFRYAALKGTPVPVRGVPDRDTITAPLLDQMVRRLDLADRPIEFWNGTAWVQEPQFTSTAPVNDGFWTMNGNIFKSVVGGRTQVTCSLELIRTGASFDITPAGSTMVIGLIPVGFRPPGNFSFVASELTNVDARYAEPQLIVNSGGSLIGRSVSGGNISMAQGYKIYLSATWFQ